MEMYTGPRKYRKLLLASASASVLGLGLIAWSDKGFAQTTTSQTPGTQAPGTQTPGTAVTLPPVRVQSAGTEGYRVGASSSPKQTSPLLDTPQTMTVIPHKIMEEQNATSLTDVLRNTPGISFNSGENGFSTGSTNFQLRGFDASGNIFIDNSRDSGTYQRDMFNVDSVEVVKGAAADNGRGGAGGYINLVTKTPQGRNFYSGEASIGFDAYGTEARKRLAADVNQMIGTNAAVRLNAMLTGGGVAGRQYATNNGWGIAPSFTIGLDSDSRATLSYEHLEWHNRPEWGVPGATRFGMTAANPFAIGAPRNAYYGLSSDYDNTVYNAVTGRLEHEFANGYVLSNQTRWSRADRSARFTVPTGFVAPSTVNTQTQFYDRTSVALTNMTNLTAKFATGSFQHTLSTGLELTREQSFANRLNTANPPATDLFYPDPDRFSGFAYNATETNRISINTAALYAYDTMKINPQWEVNGGLRLEWYTVNIEDKTMAGAPASVLDGYDVSKTQLSGRIGVVYKPQTNGSVYAAFSVSGQPPGSYLSNPDISRTGTNAFPGMVASSSGIVNYNYEIGTKWDILDSKLSLGAALFRTEKTGVPIVGRLPGEPATANSMRGTETQIVQGLEVSVAGEVLEGWNVFGGFALVDSRRQHSGEMDLVLRTANPGDYGNQFATDGNQLAFTPSFTANLWTTYRFPFGLTLGGGLQHVSSSFLGRPDDALRVIPNGRFGELPAYTVVNAMVAYDLTENVVLRLNVNNIADNTYAVSSNWNGTRVALGAPRTFILSTAVKF